MQKRSFKGMYNRTRGSIIINGSSFRLEEFSDQYITNEYLSWLTNPEIHKNILHAHPNITLEEVRDYCYTLMSSKTDYFFAIVVNEGDIHIGNVRLGPFDNNSRLCSFGMMIGNTDYHGKGIGTEVVALCIKFCFTNLGMHKLYLNVLDRNKAAIRIYEKNKFVTEGILRDQVYKDNQYLNLRLMGLINSLD